MIVTTSTSGMQIFVDGVEQKNCVYALDTAEGWVERYVLDPAGNAIMDGDSFRTARVYGVVTVIASVMAPQHG